MEDVAAGEEGRPGEAYADADADASRLLRQPKRTGLGLADSDGHAEAVALASLLPWPLLTCAAPVPAQAENGRYLNFVVFTSLTAT